MRDVRHLTVVAVAAVGLALAGCGSDGGPSQAELDAERRMVTQLQGEISDLRAQLGLPADGNLSNKITELQRELNKLRGQITKQDEMTAAATGKALYAALAGTTAGANDNALANIGAPTLAATGLTIDAAAGAGALEDATDPGGVELKAGDAVAALGSWSGSMYAHSAGTGDDKVTNDAVVYNNKGAAKSDGFGDVHTLTNGSLTVEAADIALVMADAFTHQGTQTHQTPDKSDAFYARGTYDGAPGEYSCTTGCSSTNDGKGSPSALGGTWTFTPDKGAMVSQPDGHYLYYGWWVSKDKDGPTAASAFAGRFGTDPGDSTDGLDTAGDLTTITGSATYMGNAVGKWALDYSRNKAANGTSDGGHFTADAELNATFSGTTPGITGTIDNFRLNDGTEDPGWSVALNRGFGNNLSATDGGISAPADNTATTDVNEALGTVWTIGDTAANPSGTWSGTMYDEAPGDSSATGPGDGSNIPTTVTGTFYSEFSDVGRMVGAFGANKQ